MKSKILATALAFCPLVADDVKPLQIRNDEFLIQKGDEFFIVNKMGDILSQPVAIKYDKVSPFNDGVSLVMDENLNYGYVDKNGKTIIEPKFYQAGYFSQGLAAVSLGGKFGYIDKSGKFVIKPEFLAANTFSEGLAGAVRDDKYGFIDKSGKFVIEPKYDDAWLFSEGFAAVGVDEKYGFIDTKGNYLIQPKYQSVSEFKEGLARVCDERCGFIDKSGKIVIDLKFEWANSFSEGLAAVKVDNKWGFIDKSGKMVIKPKYTQVRDFSEGFASVNTEITKKERVGILGNIRIIVLCSFIDKSGKEMIEFRQMCWTGKFKNGIARVERVDEHGYHKKGYINTHGEFVIEPVFNQTQDLSENRGWINYKKFMFLIDENANFVQKK
ncbi:WG repeat-containing protein [Campylobacter mucosalis]|uniref:WG repeat-containing protein n=1 Tax=Campylobacter mucosalis TaxID=202 RepID=UPI00146FDE24